MSTKYIASNWRLPNEENSNKSDNYGLSFDGSNNYLNIGSNIDFAGKNFSISGWYKITKSSGSSSMFSMGASKNIGIWHDGTNVNFYNKTTSWDGITAVMSKNVWHNVVCVYDGSNRYIYIDGTLANSGAKTGTQTDDGTDQLIGYLAGISSFDYEGSISEVSIFDYALSSTQISTLYGSSSLGAGNPMALKPQPVAYYPLGDNSASNPLTQPNEAVEDASVFDFDGSTQYVNCGDNDSFSFGNGSTDSPFSVSAWINMDDATKFRIVSKYVSANREYIFATSSSDLLSFALYDNSSGGRIQRKYNTALTSYEDQWIHVVGTYDGNSLSSGISIYLNGTKVDDTDANSGSYVSMENTTQPFLIGSQDGTYSNGKLSNVQIWNTELSSSDVTTLYNSGVPLLTGTQPQASSLRAWYKLDQSANWEADSSGAWQIPDAVSAYPQSFSFDGTDDNISISQINLGTSNTISIWYKSNGKTPNYFTLLGNDDAPNDYAIWVQGGTTIWYKVQDALNGNINWNVTSVNDDKWHNFIFARTDTTINFYIDGNLQTVNSNTLANNDTKIDTIGAKTNNTDNFKGELSNIQFWNTELSSSQVETLYNNGSPLTTAIASDNLKGWWKLDNTATFSTNWSIPDASGNGNTGTSSGMTEQNLVNNNVSVLNGESSGMTSANLVLSDLSRSLPYDSYSFNFDAASSDYIDCGDSDTFSFGNGTTDNPFSLSAWVKIQDATNFRIILKGDGSNMEYFLGTDSSDRVFFNIYDQTSGNRTGRMYGTSLTSYEGKWIYLASTYDGSGSNTGIKLYLNGTRVDNTSIGAGSYTAMHNTTEPLYIGRYASSYANGKFSNVSIFNEELTSTEVMKLYANGVPQDLANFNPQPQAWYPLGSNSFWNGSQWTVRDMSTGGSNDGTGQNIGIDGLVGDSPRSSANGVGTNNSIPENLVGTTKWSELNSWSINMSSEARVEDTP